MSSRRQPRIVFVVMSAVHSPGTVGQLARSLAPHRVLIHHDFAQTPAFEIDATNVRFVREPKRTGWACWGFSEGIFHSFRQALEDYSFDYLQLLSPTCLPIKPMKAFEKHVEESEAEAHFDCVDLFGNRDALMSVGYRALSPENTFRHRVLRRLSSEYYGGERARGRMEIAGVQLRTGFPADDDSSMPWKARVALAITGLATNPRFGRHIFYSGLRPFFGSVWFGARRNVIERLVEGFADERLQAYFSKLRIADEFLIPTLLHRTGARSGPANHFINTFVDANPAWLEDDDFDRLRLSHAFFARKFRDDPRLPLRIRVLGELAGPPKPGAPDARVDFRSMARVGE